MSRAVQLEIEVPDDLARFHMPEAVQARLQQLLHRQEGGETLSETERREAEGLVDLTELLSLLQLRSERLNSAAGKESIGNSGQTRALPDYSARRRRIFGSKILPNMVLAARAEELW